MKISFRKTWQIQIPQLKQLSFSADGSAIACVTTQNELILLDKTGNKKWTRKLNTEIIDVSVSNNSKVITTAADKYVSFYLEDGTCQWRKKPFPAIMARISATGEYIALLTNEPSVIKTDQNLKQKWRYSNFLKKPEDFAISHNGNTIAFCCTDDRGNGFTGVAENGKPYDAFMGLDLVTSIDVSEDGEVLLAIDSSGSIFCVNIAKSFGIWQGQLNADFKKVNLASQTCEAISYTNTGLLAKLDAKGAHVWEYRFAESLIKAFISSDGSSIYYATISGEIGRLIQSDRHHFSHIDFLEIPPVSSPFSLATGFKKIWTFDLPEPLDFSHEWIGEDGVEYCLIKSASDILTCINDLGEETWKMRITGADIYKIQVSPANNAIVALTSCGLLALDLSGKILFKSFDTYKTFFIYGDKAMLAIDEQGKSKFYSNYDHFVKTIDIKQPRSCHNFQKNILAVFSHEIMTIDPEGNRIKNRLFDQELTFISIAEKNKILSVENQTEIRIIDENLEDIFSCHFDFEIDFLAYHSALDSLFIFFGESSDYKIININNLKSFSGKISGRPFYYANHSEGIILATNVDELMLISPTAEIIARYTSPYPVIKITPSHRKNSIILFTQDLVCCLTPETQKKAVQNLDFIDI